MEAYDPELAELDSLSFGSLCHQVLESFGQDESIRNSDNPNKIYQFLKNELEKVMSKRFGRNLTLALGLQKHNLLQRLQATAHAQVEQIKNGWRIIGTETHFDALGKSMIGGLELRGKIDRIDQHESSGEIRVIDYKTSKKAKTPQETHYQIKKENWLDFQLPLYLHAMRAKYGECLNIAYFNLPADLSSTGIAEWHGFNHELLDSAIARAEEIANEIKSQQFWPPAERIPYDKFEHILHGGAELSVDPGHLV